MTGWKSKYGGIAMAIGGALLACAQVVPEPVGESSSLKLIFMLAGTFLTVGGGSLLGVGVAHKVEKNGKK